MDTPIKIIDQSKIVSSELLTIYKTKVDSSGVVHDHINVYRRPTVGVFPIDKEKNIYLLKQYRYLFEDYLIEEVSGHIDDNEKAITAAKRELEEEAGITAKKWNRLIELKSGASVVKSNMSIFVAEDLDFTHSNPEQDEYIEVFKLPLDDAIDLVYKNKITTASTIVGLLLIKDYYKKNI